jgi:hypothetical protein
VETTRPTEARAAAREPEEPSDRRRDTVQDDDPAAHDNAISAENAYSSGRE